MTEINLHQLVRTVVDEFPEDADPGVLADKVFTRITEGQYADALRTVLRSYVRRVMTEDRGFRPSVPTVTAPDKQPYRKSGYVAAMQESGLRARLMERTHGANGWLLLLRDCTVDDLLAAAAERRELAASNGAAATRYEALAAALTESGKTVLGDLADDVLEEILPD